MTFTEWRNTDNAPRTWLTIKEFIRLKDVVKYPSIHHFDNVYALYEEQVHGKRPTFLGELLDGISPADIPVANFWYMEQTK